MGNALKFATEADLRPSQRRLTSRDLDARLLESTPAILQALSRTALELDPREFYIRWRSAAIFRDLSSAEFQPIVAKAAQRQYANRQVIVQEGDEGGEVLVVAGGRVK